MTVTLVDERVTVGASERVRMRVLCSNAPVLISVNDPNGLVHLFEDLGFTDVVGFIDKPPAQWLPRAVGGVSFPDRLAWVEATAGKSLDYQSKIATDFEVTDIWDADVLTLPSDQPANGEPQTPPGSSSSDVPSTPSISDILTGAAVSTVIGVLAVILRWMATRRRNG